MRYTRVGAFSYLVTAALLSGAIGFSAWRSRPPVIPLPRDGDVEPAWAARGREVFRSECAECHPVASDLGSPIRAEPRAALDLLLRGAARFADGSARFGHPTFETLSDAALADVVSFSAFANTDSRATAPAVTESDAAVRRRAPR